MATIVKSDSPEYAIAAIAGKNQRHGEPVTAQEKAFELAEEAKKNPMDWSQWLMAGGSGLLAHAIASSMFDKSDEKKRRESIWSKVLRAVVPLGVGAAGAYGGYVLGDKIKKAADLSAALWPMWDPAARKWIEPKDLASHNGVVVDLFGEKLDAADRGKWTYAVPGSVGGVGAVVSGKSALRNTQDWRRYSRLDPKVQRSAAIEEQIDEVNRLKELRAKDNVIKANNEAAARAVADENANAKAMVDAENVAIRRQNAINVAANNKAKADFDALMDKWNKSGGKGKQPQAPTPLSVKGLKTPVVRPAPTPVPLSGVTEAQVAAATKNLRGKLGRRAAGGWLGLLASLGLGGWSAMKGYNNYKREAAIDSKLRASGVDPDTVSMVRPPVGSQGK